MFDELTGFHFLERRECFASPFLGQADIRLDRFLDQPSAWAVELVRNRETREPLVPYNASGAAAAPMTAFAAACRAEGMWPFVHFNRTHVVPPCTTTAEEMNEGLDILDRALEVADRFTA